MRSDRGGDGTGIFALLLRVAADFAEQPLFACSKAPPYPNTLASSAGTVFPRGGAKTPSEEHAASAGHARGPGRRAARCAR